MTDIDTVPAANGAYYGTVRIDADRMNMSVATFEKTLHCELLQLEREIVEQFRQLRSQHLQHRAVSAQDSLMQGSLSDG